MLVEIQTQLRGGGDDGPQGDDQRPQVADQAEELPGHRGGPSVPVSLK